MHSGRQDWVCFAAPVFFAKRNSQLHSFRSPERSRSVSLNPQSAPFPHAPSQCRVSCRRRECVQALAERASRRPAEKETDVDAAEDRVLAVVSKLSDACEGRLDQYEVREPALFADALEAVDDLELTAKFGRKGGFQVSSFQKAVTGAWTLLLTNSAVVVRNKGGLTGLPIPGAHCTKVEVTLQANGRAETKEILSWGFLRTSNSLLGKWTMTGKGDRILEVTYAEAIILGVSKMRADSKALLETTFVGKNVRLGRSKTGDLYLFKRVQDREDRS